MKFVPSFNGTWLLVSINSCKCKQTLDFCELNYFVFSFPAWVGSVSIGMTFLLSPIASILTDKFGIRTTAFIGGLMATVGMLVSSFVSSLELLYLTYGVLLGSGASLAYTPSLVILGHYFHRRLGFVNGIVTAGSSVFTMVMPLLLKYLLDTIDLSATLQVILIANLILLFCLLITMLSMRIIYMILVEFVNQLF